MPMMIAGTTIDAYLLARIIPGVGEAIMQWEQEGGLLKLIPGLVEATNAIASKFGGSNAKDKLAEATKIMEGSKDEKKEEKKSGGKAWWDFMGVFTGKKNSDSEPGELRQAWNPFKKIWNIIKSPFEAVYDVVVKPIVDFAGNVINKVGEIASNVLNSELGQILSVALPIIFPQYAWIEKVITGMRAFSALSQGNPMAAVMSLWNTGANIFPETFAKWETGIGKFFSNNFF